MDAYNLKLTVEDNIMEVSVITPEGVMTSSSLVIPPNDNKITIRKEFSGITISLVVEVLASQQEVHVTINTLCDDLMADISLAAMADRRCFVVLNRCMSSTLVRTADYTSYSYVDRGEPVTLSV